MTSSRQLLNADEIGPDDVLGIDPSRFLAVTLEDELIPSLHFVDVDPQAHECAVTTLLCACRDVDLVNDAVPTRQKKADGYAPALLCRAHGVAFRLAGTADFEGNFHVAMLLCVSDGEAQRFDHLLHRTRTWFPDHV